MNGSPPYGQRVVDRLTKALPFFLIDSIEVHLSPWLPHNRTRRCIRGARLDVLGGAAGLPPPLPRVGDGPPLRLGDLLDFSLPSIRRSQITSVTQKENLFEYEEKIISL